MTQDFERDMRASMGEVRETVARIDVRTETIEARQAAAEAKHHELDQRVDGHGVQLARLDEREKQARREGAKAGTAMAAVVSFFSWLAQWVATQFGGQ